jgi:DNA-binding transcriptional LysR family regulator
MNYTYLNIFYTVAKLQNISKAAEVLGVSQPAVSRIISNIEKEYHTKLFFSSKTGVSLTRDGYNLFEMVKGPLIELEKISDNIDTNKTLEKITIHIGATSTALYCYLFKHLENDIKKLFPNVNFRIYSDSSTRLLDMVNKGSIDFAFITTPYEHQEELDIYNIAKLNDILIAPTKYKGIINEQISVKELEKYPFILLSKEMQFREYIDAYLNKYNTRINPVYETDSSALLTSFVELGYGLTFVPDEMASKAINENKCYKIKIKEPLPNRYIAFAIKKDKVHNSIIDEIKKEILENI